MELDSDQFGKVNFKMVPIVFLGLQNLNDTLHLKELIAWSFCSCKGYLWSSSRIVMTSSWGVVGARNLSCIGQGYLRN
jgi:hypothetical protein